MRVKTRLNFQCRGLTMGTTRYKNKELTLLITNNS